ncbi:hypothetical protein [Rubripirellula reticaptiva]|uniref:Uncharacterized protein n=1 Tax=Rubripirellula reticaptiva TaxID=2528013 RepID=A0A5C6FBV1_9BACT|nr:hypothetical protein [Rubripirellula reticaptiva]TWU57101.1 hypothetical protein Poly59_00060 [Rubripirellula reticaptiva]
MTTTQERIGKMIVALKQERDELRVRLHLGKENFKDDWDVLEGKLTQLSDDYKPLREAVDETTEDVWDSFKLVGSEISDGFKRIRKSL